MTNLPTNHNQLVIQASRNPLDLRLRLLWKYRELLYFLVWRDIKVRYKQTALGITWVILQPLISMLVYSGLFGVLLQVPTGDVPYPIFVLCGLLPWQYFAFSLNKSSNSLIDNTNLITKIFFPRLVLPLSAVFSGLVDFAVSAVILGLLMAIYQITPTPAILFLPFFLLFAILTALGFSLWFSALNVRYRDIKHLMPFIIQIWMYLTPVVYGSELIPVRYRWLLSLNPMTGVVNGFRWALLGEQLYESTLTGLLFWVSVVAAGLVLVSGVIYFRITERTFADII